MGYLKHSFLTAALIAFFSVASMAQDHSGANTGFTPYSMFGLGQLAPQGTSYNHVKGGIGIGDRNVRFINLINPAAVTARESKSFMMDFGMRGNCMLLEANASSAAFAQGDDRLKSANNTFNMNHIVMSFPITNTSAFKVGIMPYSSTGYYFTAEETSDDLTSSIGDIRYTRFGSGGIYQVFLGAGITFFKRFSVGIDGYYYFGNINHATNADFRNTGSTYRAISTGWYYSMSGFGGKVGLQYEQPLKSGRSLTVGATFLIPTRLGGEVTRYSFGELSSSTDTVHYKTTEFRGYDIPLEWGVGVTYKSNDKLTVGFDYKQQKWSHTAFLPTPGVDFSPADMRSFRLGAEWTPSRYDVRHYMKTLTYHAGAYYENSYISLNSHQINSMGFTLGVTFPIFRYYNSITFGVDLGQNGTLTDSLIRERYIKFTLSFSFHDIWFIKQLYE